jgi:hypothetical protein
MLPKREYIELKDYISILDKIDLARYTSRSFLKKIKGELLLTHPDKIYGREKEYLEIRSLQETLEMIEANDLAIYFNSIAKQASKHQEEVLAAASVLEKFLNDLGPAVKEGRVSLDDAQRVIRLISVYDDDYEVNFFNYQDWFHSPVSDVNLDKITEIDELAHIYWYALLAHRYLPLVESKQSGPINYSKYKDLLKRLEEVSDDPERGSLGIGVERRSYKTYIDEEGVSDGAVDRAEARDKGSAEEDKFKEGEESTVDGELVIDEKGEGESTEEFGMESVETFTEKFKGSEDDSDSSKPLPDHYQYLDLAGATVQPFNLEEVIESHRKMEAEKAAGVKFELEVEKEAEVKVEVELESESEQDAWSEEKEAEEAAKAEEEARLKKEAEEAAKAEEEARLKKEAEEAAKAEEEAEAAKMERAEVRRIEDEARAESKKMEDKRIEAEAEAVRLEAERIEAEAVRLEAERIEAEARAEELNDILNLAPPPVPPPIPAPPLEYAQPPLHHHYYYDEL